MSFFSGSKVTRSADYNLFEGTEVTGSPEVVVRRGEILVENGELVAPPGSGRFVPRARVGEELKPGSRSGRGSL